MHYIHFVPKNSSSTILQIREDNETITNVTYTKSLGQIIGNTATCESHIDQLINRLSSGCYAIR
jgi:hypothetical protein